MSNFLYSRRVNADLFGDSHTKIFSLRDSLHDFRAYVWRETWVAWPANDGMLDHEQVDFPRGNVEGFRDGVLAFALTERFHDFIFELRSHLGEEPQPGGALHGSNGVTTTTEKLRDVVLWNARLCFRHRNDPLFLCRSEAKMFPLVLWSHDCTRRLPELPHR